ncbi:MAG: recombinase zinc beta ribbon domain-containing protein, partial [Oscillospiraceae bacterium]|nr:recombinase zinc beta ribbon domain-containing protein [Oscillospiraceae bacterium]
MFEAAQHIRMARANSAEQERTVPRDIGGKALLSGNVFCDHCGARLALTTNGKAYPCAEDPHRIVKRVRYICYGKTRKQTECDGQVKYIWVMKMASRYKFREEEIKAIEE